MATVIKLLPSLQHLNIRILDKEQLEKITDELVEDIEKLDCLEIPFSSVLLSGLYFFFGSEFGYEFYQSWDAGKESY